jgi:hypothetical protein
VLPALFPHHVVGDLSTRCFAWPLGESDRETNMSVVDGEEVRRCDDEGDMMCNSGWDETMKRRWIQRGAEGDVLLVQA